MQIQLSADPSLVWISDSKDHPDFTNEVLHRVISWLKLANRNHVKMHVDLNATIKLYETSLVPSENHITELVNKAGCEGVVVPQELAKLINEIVIASCDLPTPPDKIAEFTNLGLDLSAAIPDGSKRDLSKEAFLNFCLSWGTSQEDLSYVFPRVSQEIVATSNEIRVETFETSEPKVFDDCDVGLEVSVYGMVSGFYASLDPRKIWSSASSELFLEEAIRSLASQNNINHTALKPFSFGSSFFATAKKNGGISGSISSVLMNKIYAIVTGSDGVAISSFRVEAKQSAPVRIRHSDKAEARRVHLTQCHEGYRLMFWELNDGSLEFANVGPKFEEKIYP